MARKLYGRSFWSYWSTMFRDRDDAPEDIVTEESFTLGEAPSGGSAVAKGGGGGAKRDPSQSIVKKLGISISNSSGGSSDFEEPDYDFQEITDAYNTEGYIRQAIDKYIEMMFKADWDFVGKNPNAVEYIRMRFMLMAEATQIPTSQLFIEIAEDLVKYHNVVIAKARAKDTLPFQGMNVQGIGGASPVAGYFPLNMTTMKVKRDANGTIKGWQQESESSSSGKTVKFKTEDIVHMYYKREKGRAFGTPFLLPALDDLRALRQIEENVLRLVYRNLHPLWHAKVGLEGEGLGAVDGEVETVQTEIENMNVEGGLVTTERVNINPIASNQIIDANSYLKYFEQRAFTVLGVSELMMGRGNTANRSTGDNLSGEFTDRVKAMQKVISTFVNEFMLKEILMEGGFDPVLNPDDAVRFQFNEIDLDSKIKAENQAVFLYEHNAITESEMRELVQRDPIEDGEDRAGMHLNVITFAQMNAAAAMAPASSDETSGSSTSKPNDKKKETDNKQKPQNQHGVKSSPKKATNSLYSSEMISEYNLLQKALHRVIEQQGDDEMIGGAILRSQENMLAVTERFFDEETKRAIDIPLRRMCEQVYRDVLSANALEESKEDYVDTVLTVYIDRLDSIGNKAIEHYQHKEVEKDGQE